MTSSQHLKDKEKMSVQSAVAKSFDGVVLCMVHCEALSMSTLKQLGTYSGETKSAKCMKKFWHEEHLPDRVWIQTGSEELDCHNYFWHQT